MSQSDTLVANGHDQQLLPGSGRSKTKQKKTVDSNEASKLLAARISQLEQDAAGEKDQEAEIEREVKRANRDLLQQVSKMDPMEKIDHLLKRCSELAAELRRVTRQNKENKARGDNLQKDKDLNRAELSKTVGLKEKLEKLCRELQKDNNKFKNENKDLQNTQKRTQLAYDQKYSLLLTKLEGYQEEKETPRKSLSGADIDELFQQRFKAFIEQYELRELHFHSVLRTKELEVQYSMARYEEEKKTTDTEASKARHLQSQVQTFTKTETDLRNQLNLYIDKFKQVEETLNNSNDLFLSFRKEMEDMSKKTKKLEKENEALKRKLEITTSNILGMAEEREDWKRKSDAADKKVNKLMSIIQQMQQQGRKVPSGMTGTIESCYTDSYADGGIDVDNSDYAEEDEDQEEDEDDEGHEDDLSEDYEDPVRQAQPSAAAKNAAHVPAVASASPSAAAASAVGRGAAPQANEVVYGPERPPQMAKPTVNGH